MNLKKHCFSLTHCVIFYFTRGILSQNYLSVQWTVDTRFGNMERVQITLTVVHADVHHEVGEKNM